MSVCQCEWCATCAAAAECRLAQRALWCGGDEQRTTDRIELTTSSALFVSARLVADTGGRSAAQRSASSVESECWTAGSVWMCVAAMSFAANCHFSCTPLTIVRPLAGHCRCHPNPTDSAATPRLTALCHSNATLPPTRSWSIPRAFIGSAWPSPPSRLDERGGRRFRFDSIRPARSLMSQAAPHPPTGASGGDDAPMYDGPLPHAPHGDNGAESSAAAAAAAPSAAAAAAAPAVPALQHSASDPTVAALPAPTPAVPAPAPAPAVPQSAAAVAAALLAADPALAARVAAYRQSCLSILAQYQTHHLIPHSGKVTT